MNGTASHQHSMQHIFILGKIREGVIFETYCKVKGGGGGGQIY